ncbi:MAG TPA: response regulator transcription factor [Alphaproteobacteria bacterium]|nr:response regulator transcription factor [Alphaproteobacteria bacterium]
MIVDDQGLIQEGLSRIIGGQQDLEVCGSADGASAALKAVALHKPDLVLVDILLPDGCGVELIKNLVSEYPTVLALVISQCDETVYAERALKAGARGFVMKNRAVSEIPKAIRAVLAGEFYVSPQVAALALNRMGTGHVRSQRDTIGKLTDRELQIFQLLGAGVATRDIAIKLQLSIKTVQTHRESIKHKLKLPNAVALRHFATNWVTSQRSARVFPNNANFRE